MNSEDIFLSLGKTVVTSDGVIGVLLGCMENDDELAIRDYSNEIHFRDRRMVRLWL